MKRETTGTRVATQTAAPQSTKLLIGALYGMVSGLALALILLSGLVPSQWAEEFAAGPFVFQGVLTAVGAALGALLAAVRAVSK